MGSGSAGAEERVERERRRGLISKKVVSSRMGKRKVAEKRVVESEKAALLIGQFFVTVLPQTKSNALLCLSPILPVRDRATLNSSQDARVFIEARDFHPFPVSPMGTRGLSH